jgi:drug/metabolite transporter (DMT)-like permease
VLSRRVYALTGLVLLMIVWGSTFVVTKAAAREIPPFTLGFLRFLIASGVLLPVAAWQGGMRRLPRPIPWVSLACMGLMGIALFSFAFNHALVYASAVQGALIFSLLPAAIALAAVIFLKETPSQRRLLGIALSVAGVTAIVAAGRVDVASSDPVLGALCMLGAVVAWAGYTVFSKRLAGADQVVVMACVSLVGAALLMPFATLELWERGWPSPSLTGWLSTLFLGSIASALAFVVYGRVLRELDTSLVGAYANLDPIVGVLTGVVFLGETLSRWQLLGGAVALAGMWLASSNAASPRPARARREPLRRNA